MAFFKRGFGKDKDRNKAPEPVKVPDPVKAPDPAAQPQASALNEIRDKSAVSSDELCKALEDCKASLANIESLSPEDIEKATNLLDECAHLVKGRDAKVDITELDQRLLVAINDSLIKFFMYGQFDLDIQDARPAWQRALGKVKENILARTGDADEVYDAIIRLNILSLRAMNCSLNDMIATQLQYISDVKEQYRKFCSENGITDIENVLDPYLSQRLQILLEAIRQAEDDIKNNRSIITPNMHDISSMESLLKQRKVSKNSMSLEEFERIRDIIKSGNDTLLKIHNDAIARQEEMQKRIKEADARRDLMERERSEVAPVISQVERRQSKDILEETKQEAVTVQQEQTQLVEETLTE